MRIRIAYQFDKDNYYIGETQAYAGLLPHNSTFEKPAQTHGYIPCWTGSAWQQVEDHKGLAGWLDGEPYTIAEPGPVPDGFTIQPPLPTPEEIKQHSIAEIKAQLAQTDMESTRPLRAVINSSATEEDYHKLAQLEQRASELRAQLEELEDK